MSLGNGKGMELKLIKHDKALYLGAEEILKRLNDWAARLQRALSFAGKGVNEKDGPNNGVSEMAKSWS